MFNFISDYFKSPDDNDPDFIRLVRDILIFTIVITVIVLIAISGILGLAPGTEAPIILSITIFLEIVVLIFVNRGNLLPAKIVVPFVLIIAISILTSSANGLHDIATLGYPMIVIVAFLLQGNRAMIVTTPFVAIAIIVIGVLDMTGYITSIMSPFTGWDDIAIGLVLTVGGGAILRLVTNRLSQSLIQARNSEAAQREANQELRKLQASLEERVEERTARLEQRSTELAQQSTELARKSEELEKLNTYNAHRAAQFEAISQVSRSIASVRNINELLPEITRLISKYYGFYHVGIFLADESKTYAVLSAANSEGGQRMLQRGHRLEIGKVGIVGFVTGTGLPRVALDTGADAVHFKNPDLPDTHSEMALPLRAGGEIVGALDVQSLESNAFSQEDVDVLSTLADQVSIAIQNSQLFETTQKSLAEAEALYRQSLRKEWAKTSDRLKIGGYRYNILGTTPVEHVNEQQVEQVISSGNIVIEKDENSSKLALPIKLRGEVIGILDVLAPGNREWQQDEIDIVQAVAERVAISAENARLFEETTNRAERERMVSEITTKIRSTNDPNQMLQVALNEIRQALKVKDARIIPYSPPQDTDKG